MKMSMTRTLILLAALALAGAAVAEAAECGNEAGGMLYMPEHRAPTAGNEATLTPAPTAVDPHPWPLSTTSSS